MTTLVTDEMFLAAMQEGFMDAFYKHAAESWDLESQKIAGLADMLRGAAGSLRQAASGAASSIGSAASSAASGAASKLKDTGAAIRNFVAGGVDPKTGLPMKSLLGTMTGQGEHTNAGRHFFGASALPAGLRQPMGPQGAKPLFGAAGKVMSPQEAAAGLVPKGSLGPTPVAPPAAAAAGAAAPLPQVQVVQPKPMGYARSGGGFSRPERPVGGRVNMFGQPQGPSPFAPTAPGSTATPVAPAA